jgi:serine/threonine protein kinase
MVTGQLPWTKKNQTQLFEQIRSSKYTIPAFVSSQCADLIRRMLTVDFRRRITIPEIAQHPFMVGAQLPKPIRTVDGFVSLRRIDDCFGAPPENIDVAAILAVRRTLSFRMHSFQICAAQLMRARKTEPPAEKKKGFPRYFERRESPRKERPIKPAPVLHTRTPERERTLRPKKRT